MLKIAMSSQRRQGAATGIHKGGQGGRESGSGWRLGNALRVTAAAAIEASDQSGL